MRGFAGLIEGLPSREVAPKAYKNALIEFFSHRIKPFALAAYRCYSHLLTDYNSLVFDVRISNKD